MHHGEFRDPPVAALYDQAFGWTHQDDYFVTRLGPPPAPAPAALSPALSPAAAFRAVRDVADLGCGTGRLAIALAARGFRVTGADPAAASLDLARRKPGAEAVTWLLGSAEVLPSDAFDAVLMTSHVAQFLVTDEEFATALGHLHRALRPGGRLVFDTRDPAARAWERWNPRDSRRAIGAVTTWTTTDHLGDGVVSGTQVYEFPDGTRRVATAQMRFRPEALLRRELTAAGFTVETVHGGWNGEPVGHPDGEFLVTARRPGPFPAEPAP